LPVRLTCGLFPVAIKNGLPHKREFPPQSSRAWAQDSFLIIARTGRLRRA
jgi:hypothetical protein